MAPTKDTSAKFYGVYLLCSQSAEKRYKGKCYIGFTVNPNRRINQHNRGKEFGGARKTSNKGPWLMVMIVHGFPNNIAALQFEWAWQQPTLSSRLKNYPELRRKAPKETYFQYNFRILCRMLQVGPWNRLPLIIRWLETEYEQNFDLSNLPPAHMKIISGYITALKPTQSSKRNAIISTQTRPMWAHECHLCMQEIECPERARIGCLNNTCKLTCHIICLANHLIAADSKNRGHYIPIGGQCPLCDTELNWAALLQRKAELQLRDSGIAGNEEFHDDDDQSNSDDDSIDQQLIDCISDEECELYEISD